MTTALAAQQEGSRWLHARPSSEDVVAWFERQRLHKGMEHAPYVSGVVVINSTEKVKRTVQGDNGRQYVDEIEQAVFTPYVKVDTRVSYFWDYAHILNAAAPDGVEYVASIQPADVPVIEDPQSPWYNAYLPSGYHYAAQKHRQGDAVVRYICFTADVDIVRYRELESGGEDIRTVLRGRGTKMVPTVGRNGYADDFSLMKAETGAVGRALGMAGVLVIGTGVATAEDVQEAQAQPYSAGTVDSGPSLPEVVAPAGVDAGMQGAVTTAPTIPAEVPTPQVDRTPETGPLTWEQMDDEGRLAYAQSLAKAHRDEFPAEYQAVFMPWWKDREFGNITDLTPDELQTVVIKLERDLDALRASARR